MTRSTMRILFVTILLATGGLALAGAQIAPPTPSPTNAALRHWMAFAQMQNPPGEALAAELARVEAGEMPVDEVRHGPLLDANAAAIATMLRAADLPVCDWGIETDPGPFAPIAHLARARALARLNTIAGARSMARGNLDVAVEHWVGGLRFSQHVAAGGSLVAALSATSVLRSTLGAIERAAAAGALADDRARTLRDALGAIPTTGVAWDEAWRHELAGVDVWIRQLAADPVAFEQVTGRAPASRPAPGDLAAFRRFMARVADALALPPDTAQGVLLALEQERSTLHDWLDGLIPSLPRVNETRTQLMTDRERVLALLAG